MEEVEADEVPSMAVSESDLELLFYPPKDRQIVDSARDEKIFPINPLANDGAITFVVQGFDNEFINLSNTMLWLKVKVEKANGEKLPSYEEEEAKDKKKRDKEAAEGKVPEDNHPAVSIPLNFLDCLIKKIGVEVNGINVGSGHSYNAQVGTLKNLLSYPEDLAKSTLKESAIWEVVVS